MAKDDVDIDIMENQAYICVYIDAYVCVWTYMCIFVCGLICV